MLVALIPAAAAAALAAMPLVRFEPPPPQDFQPAPELRHARTPTLPIRPGTIATSLRHLKLRGQDVAFGEGSMEAATDDGPSRPFTLKHTTVDANIAGFVSQVVVTQEFANPFDEPVEAVYVFPLPDDAAVDEMTLTAGNRVIRASIQKRETARRMYEEAKSQGRRAALLDQERPNIFTQSVANLQPGETVKVSLRYVAPLAFDDGVFTFNYPMVVGPRYVPGNALGGQSQGTGQSPDTDQVVDASRITPPAQRTGRDIQVRVHLDAGSNIEELWSVSHTLLVQRPANARAELALEASDRVPNKDLILRWRVAGAEKRAAAIATGGPGGTFALSVYPPVSAASLAPMPKEMVFVIDTSCSMSGAPLRAAKSAMSAALEQMSPEDTFLLIDFADRASTFSEEPLPATPTNVRKAQSYLVSLPGGGGTNQLAGLRAALNRPGDPGRLRMVLLMTDGFIGNDREVLAAGKEMLGDARIFGFGVGSSVNHFLLARLSEVGRGFYQYVRPDEDWEPAVKRFVRRVNRPQLTDVEIDWGGLEVADVLPRTIPDLFDAQPLRLLGHYRQPGTGVVTVRGRIAGRPVELRTTVEFPAHEQPGASALRTTWARARIEELERTQDAGEKAEAINQITALGLEHHLVTAYTSLVAVEDVVAGRPGEKTVTEPTEVADLTGSSEGSAPQRYRLSKPMPKPGPQRMSAAAPPMKELLAAVDKLDPDPAARTPGSPAGDRFRTGGLIGKAPVAGTDSASAFGAGGGGLGVKGGELLRGKGGGGALGAGRGSRSAVVTPPKGVTVTYPMTFRSADDGDDDSSGSDDFSKSFGTGSKGEEGKLGKRSVYVPPPPSGTPRSSAVQGSLSRDAIRKVVNSRMGQLNACIERYKLKVPSESGKFVLQWAILPNGNVEFIKVKSSTTSVNHPIALCMMNVIKASRFPGAVGGKVIVAYPFIYSF